MKCPRASLFHSADAGIYTVTKLISHHVSVEMTGATADPRSQCAVHIYRHQSTGNKLILSSWVQLKF